MKLAVLSDMHGNATALEAVLARLDSIRIDHAVCLGDIVGYGARPGLCVRLVRECCDASILGNHDRAVLRPETAECFNEAAAAALRWTAAQIRDDERVFLASLADTARYEGVLLCHGAPSDPDRYISGLRQAATEFHHFTEALALFGHTHVPACIRSAGGDRILADVHACRLEPGRPAALLREDRHLVNPGSVGQPRDLDPRASFLELDTATRSVTLHRVAYDIASEQARMAAVGLPTRLIRRLSAGV